MKSVEAESHVGGFCAKPQFESGREGQHGRPPRVWTRERTKSRSAWAVRRRTAPQGRTISTGGVVGFKVTGKKVSAELRGAGPSCSLAVLLCAVSRRRQQ